MLEISKKDCVFWNKILFTFFCFGFGSLLVIRQFIFVDWTPLLFKKKFGVLVFKWNLV
jgi:hypothetical protein